MKQPLTDDEIEEAISIMRRARYGVRADDANRLSELAQKFVNNSKNLPRGMKLAYIITKEN